MDNSVDIIYSELVKVENEDKGYGLVTFLVWHEVYGYFKVTEEIDVDAADVAKYYREELDGTDYDWTYRTEEEWELLYEAEYFELVNLD